MQKTQILFLGQVDPLEKGNGYPLQDSCLENSWRAEPGGLESMGLQRVAHDWATRRTHKAKIFLSFPQMVS